MRVLTDNFAKRLARANEVCRSLRQKGFHVHTCVVKAGDSIEKAHIEVSGGALHPRIDAPDCHITRYFGRGV